MEVRRAEPADLEDVIALITLFFAAEGFTTPPDAIRRRAPQFLEGTTSAAFLAFDGDDAIGIGTVTTSFGFEGGSLAEVEDLYVRPEHRRRGVATTLLGEAMMWSRQQGYESLRVVVTPEDESRKERLIAWYARLGYTDTGRLVLHFDDGP